MSNQPIRIILVEDDNDDIYLFHNEAKKAFGAQAIIVDCHSLAELNDIDELNSDVIMLDLGLPDSQGLNTVVKVVNQFSGIPVIVLTGVNDIDTGGQAIQLGAEDYIPKEELTHNLISRSIRFSIERHGLLNKVRNMAHVDTLTLLHNRAYFLDRLEQQCSLAQRNAEEFGVIMIDLDGFKDVNDTFGHGVGDQVLEQFSARLKSSTRRADVLARYGGDEFVILVSPLLSYGSCEQVAKSKLDCIKEPFLIYHDGRVEYVKIGMSIGYAIFPTDGETGSRLLSCADKAMYAVKETGKNGFKAYGGLESK